MNRTTSTLMSLGISVALIAAGIWFLHRFPLGFNNSKGMMQNHMMMREHSMGIIMLLFWLTVAAAIVLIISGAITNRNRSEKSNHNHFSHSLQILKSPYAKSNIDKTQLDTIPRDLS